MSLHGHEGLLAQIRRTATRAGRLQSGRFSLEGDRLHERALRAGVAVEAVVVSRSYRDDVVLRRQNLLRELERRGSEVLVVDDERMVALTEGRDIGAIVGLCKIPTTPTLTELRPSRLPGTSALLVACDIEEPGNVGALVRTGLASGAPALVALGNSDPFHPKAVRTSMGAIFRLPVLRYVDPDRMFSDFAVHGVESIAAVSQGGTSLPELELPTRIVAFLIGGESFGLPEEVTARATRRVTIPMIERVDSLSVNAVAAVLLYEVQRRRKGPGPPCAGREGAVR